MNLSYRLENLLTLKNRQDQPNKQNYQITCYIINIFQNSKPFHTKSLIKRKIMKQINKLLILLAVFICSMANIIKNGQFTDTTCSALIKSQYRNTRNNNYCQGTYILNNWFSNQQVTLLNNNDLYNNGQFYYSPTSYKGDLVMLNFMTFGYDQTNNIQIQSGFRYSSLYQALPRLYAGKYQIKLKYHFLEKAKQIDLNNLLNSYNILTGVIFMFSPLLFVAHTYQALSASADNILILNFQLTLQFMSTVNYETYDDGETLQKFLFIVSGLSSSTNYSLGIQSVEMKLAECMNPQNQEIRLLKNSKNNIQVCINKQVVQQSINCISYDFLGPNIYTQFRCSQCPLNYQIINVQDINSAAIYPGCYKILYPNVQTYYKTNTKNQDNYYKPTINSCDLGFSPSYGKLRIKDFFDPSNVDESGRPCVAKDIKGIKIWQLDQVNVKYVPVQCNSYSVQMSGVVGINFNIYTLSDGVTQGCIHKDIVDNGFGCSGFNLDESFQLGFQCVACANLNDEPAPIKTTSTLQGVIKACIPKIVIDQSYGCKIFQKDSTNGFGYSCSQCIETSYKLITIDQNPPLAGQIKGCNAKYLPKAKTYRPTSLLDDKSQTIFTVSTCDPAQIFLSNPAVNKLELADSSGLNFDRSGTACIQNSNYVQYYKINRAQNDYQIISCDSTKAITADATGNIQQIDCIPKQISDLSLGCQGYAYVSTNPYKYECSICLNSPKYYKVKITNTLQPSPVIVYACNFIKLPHVETYTLTSLVDINTKSLFTSAVCEAGFVQANGKLTIIAPSNDEDKNGIVCLPPTTDNVDVTFWTVDLNQNQYEPAQCGTGSFKIITQGGQFDQECVDKATVDVSYNCETYLVDNAGYVCSGCSDNTKYTLVKVQNSLGKIVKGCTLIQIPLADEYKPSTISNDGNGMVLLTSATCQTNFVNGPGINKLRLELTDGRYDDTAGVACINNYANIAHWHIVNNVYEIYDCVEGEVLFLDNGTKYCSPSPYSRDLDCKIYGGPQVNFDCQTCDDGTQRAAVEILSNIYIHCLDQITQIIPGCNLYILVNQIYYCKSLNCQIQSGFYQIPIGPNNYQIGCTSFTNLFGTFGFGLCNYYKRPNLQDTELLCSSCKNSPVQVPPYCRAIISNNKCPVNFIAILIKYDPVQKCVKYNLIQYCSYYKDVTGETAGPCSECFSGFFLVDDVNGNKICIFGPVIQGCLAYDTNGSCLICKKGLRYNTVLNVCPTAAHTKILNCHEADILGNNQVRCRICQNGYRLKNQFNKSSCIAGIQFCSQYFGTSKQFCKLCAQDYYVSSDYKSCIKINSDDKCIEFNFTSNKCSECMMGYEQNSQGICVKQFKCHSDQYKNASNLCTDGVKVNCQKFESPTGDCLVCKLGWGFNNNGDCLLNISKLICQEKSDEKTRYYVENGICKQTDQICGDTNVDGTCKYCLSSEYYLFNGVCRSIFQSQSTESNLRRLTQQILLL